MCFCYMKTLGIRYVNFNKKYWERIVREKYFKLKAELDKKTGLSETLYDHLNELLSGAKRVLGNHDIALRYLFGGKTAIGDHHDCHDMMHLIEKLKSILTPEAFEIDEIHSEDDEFDLDN